MVIVAKLILIIGYNWELVNLLGTAENFLKYVGISEKNPNFF